MNAGVWLAIGSFGVGAASLWLLRYVWRVRSKPGARWFVVVILFQVVICLTQGAAVLVFDRSTRLLLEMPFWVFGVGLGAPYLAFAAEYTGRANVVDSWAFRGVAALTVGFAALAVTNPLTQWVWNSFRVEPAYGVATAEYAPTPLALSALLFLGVLTAVGIFWLIDTVASYGPVYRTQAVAIALTPVFPFVAAVAWLYDVGPIAAVNLTPIMFLPHVVLDVYALFGEDMFQFNPATRRTAERTAIEDLGNPVVIVDEDGRIVTLNAAARSLFGVDKATALAEGVESYLDIDRIDFAGEDQRVHLRDGRKRRTFTVATTPLRDGTDAVVGHTVVFQDVTGILEREQRLAVLNRVLRHNLRNDLTVVRGNVELAAEAVEDEAVAERLADAEAEVSNLLDLSEKVRTVERTVGRENHPREVVDLRALVAEVVADLEADVATTAAGGPDAPANPDGGAPPDAPGVAVDIPADLRLRTTPELVAVVVTNLVENAVEHGAAPVTVSVAGRDPSVGEVTLAVSDEGPGIPEHELAVVDAGEETPLDHGSGLGLWLVAWAVDALGGTVSYESDGQGTTALVTLPGLLAD